MSSQRALESAARPAEATQEAPLADLSPHEMHQSLHALRVAQIELEMQNDELRNAQLTLQTLQARYFDLYDLAPVGYATVGITGRILDSNAYPRLSISRKTAIVNPSGEPRVLGISNGYH
jgi:hypothetical protein